MKKQKGGNKGNQSGTQIFLILERLSEHQQPLSPRPQNLDDSYSFGRLNKETRNPQTIVHKPRKNRIESEEKCETDPKSQPKAKCKAKQASNTKQKQSRHSQIKTKKKNKNGDSYKDETDTKKTDETNITAKTTKTRKQKAIKEKDEGLDKCCDIFKEGETQENPFRKARQSYLKN